MRVRIVVADRSEACFYDASRHDLPLQLVGRLTNPQARLHNRDLKSDRPGRVFDHAAGGRRRGATAHHATGGERDPLQHEAESFARRIVEELEKTLQQHPFDRLVLIAEPGFLGDLRRVLPRTLMNILVLQVNKDLVRQDERAIRNNIAADVVFALSLPAG